MFGESHPSLISDFKFHRMMEIMGWKRHELKGALQLFWDWCLEHCTDGDLRKYKRDEYPEIVNWILDVGDVDLSSKFFDAMVTVGFIDEEPYFRIHNWYTYTSYALSAHLRRRKPYLQHIRVAYGFSPTVINEELDTSEETVLLDDSDDSEKPKPNYEEIKDQWNRAAKDCGLATVEKLTDKRKKGIASRLSEAGFSLEKILSEIIISDFLKGQAGSSTWKGATFDWIFCAKDNWVKIIEGQYRNKANTGVNGKTNGKWNTPKPPVSSATSAFLAKKLGSS